MGVAEYDAEVLSDSPSAYWKLNETSGTTAVDSIAGLNGTYGGDFSLNSDNFDGTPAVVMQTTNGGYVTIADNNLWSTHAGSSGVWAAEIWFKPDMTEGGTTVRELFSKATTSSTEYEFRCNKTSTGTGSLSGNIGNAAGSAFAAVVKSNSGVQNTNWHHLVLSYDRPGVTFKMFVDGVLVGTDTNLSALSVNTPSSLFIGRTTYFPTSDWRGSLSRFAIYPAALTDAQVADHYAAYTFSPHATPTPSGLVTASHVPGIPPVADSPVVEPDNLFPLGSFFPAS